MPRIGIIACQVLEKEIAHLLDERTDIDKIYIRPTPENKQFAGLLKKHTVTRINEPDFLKNIVPKIEIVLEVLPVALHTDVDELEFWHNEHITKLKY